MQDDYDIVIIGAGLIGCCLAYALAQQNFRVILVEQKDLANLTITDNRSIVLTDSSVQILKNLQLWPLLVNQAYPIEQVQISRAGHFGTLRFNATDHQMATLGYVIPGQFLTQTLQQLILNASNIVKIFPATLRDFKKTDHQVICDIETPNGTSAFTTHLLVGADGIQSQVRRLQAIPIKNTDYHQTAVIATLETTQLPNATAYERFTRLGPLAILPRGIHQRGLIWTVANTELSYFKSLSDDSFLTLVQQMFGYRLGKFLNCSARQYFPLQLQQAEQYAQPQVILVGNAAQTLHPIAGQGFNLGLRDVASLIEALLTAQRQQQPWGGEAFLNHYLLMRQQDQKRIIQFTDGVVRLFSQPWSANLASLSFPFLNNLPFFKKYLVKTLLGNVMPNLDRDQK